MAAVAPKQIESCGAAVLQNTLQATDPTAAIRRAQLERYLQQRLATPAAGNGPSHDASLTGDPPGTGSPTVYAIPVIFHLIEFPDPNHGYNSAMTTLVSQAQVQSQLDALNNDMQLLNADAANMNSGFRTDFLARPANANIRFCLARRNPQGDLLPEPGIDRFSTPSTPYFDAYAGNSTVGNFPKDPNRGGVATWPPSEYLNVWVCDIGGGPTAFNGTLGITTYPDNTTEDEGIIIHTTAFGVGGTAIVNGARYGRSLTHEIGHWLNLEHIWGQYPINSPSCGDTDNVGDTPNQYNASYTVYNGPCSNNPQYQNSGGACSATYPGDLFMNYMDYGSDQCRYMFTPGQVARMRLMFDPATPFTRAALLNSLALAPTQVSFTHTRASTTLCPNDQTPFRVRALLPDGTPCAGTISYQWSIPAGWSINSPTFGYPVITPNGTTGGTIGLTVTYTNGTRSLSLTAPSITFTIGGSAPAAPTFSSSGNLCLGATGTFAVQSVSGATGYTWQVPAGFSIQGSATGSAITVVAPSLTSGAATSAPYTVSVSATMPTGCPSNTASTSFWLGTGDAVITIPALTSGRVCANTRILATATIPVRNQGTNTNFTWTQRLNAGTPNGCQNTTVGADIYTYVAEPGLPANQMYISTGVANNQVQVWVDFDNSCGGHKQATVIFSTVANLNGTCPPDVYCRPAPAPVKAKPYPNPTTGLVTVEQLAGSFRVYNGQGTVVQEATARPGAATQLDLRRLPAGLYQLIGQDQSGRAVRHAIQLQP